jgi:cytochrome c biogenesis protein CcmG, thiol:disulfide interchange protein DsbE
VTRRVKLAAQAGAVTVVAALLALLVWKVATNSPSKVRSYVIAGKIVRAPDFKLSRLNGDGELSLAALRGRVVVVNFWASWCHPCKDESPALEAAWNKFRARGVVFVGVNVNDVRGYARRFVRENGITYPVVADRGAKVLADYGVAQLPETFVVDRRGKLIPHLFAGPIKSTDDGERLDQYIRHALRT